jgi:RNA-binding protein YlmH
MIDEEKLLEKRFAELSARAYSRGIRQYSDFLSLSGQDVLLRMRLESKVTLIGGFETAERRIACFEPNDCDYEQEPPITCVCIEPISQKFADRLTHRDFLGSLIGLGIRREVLGDIVIHENRGYLICAEDISGYIIDTLKKVKHTDVKCYAVDNPPKVSTALPDISRVVIASERIDAVVAAVFNVSRSDSQDLFTQGKVFIKGMLTESLTAAPKQGDIVSVRGLGRFIYEGIERETKKGKLRVMIRKFT